MSSREEIDEINRILDEMKRRGVPLERYLLRIGSFKDRENLPNSYAWGDSHNSVFSYDGEERIEDPITPIKPYTREITFICLKEVGEIERPQVVVCFGRDGKKSIESIYSESPDMKKILTDLFTALGYF